MAREKETAGGKETASSRDSKCLGCGKTLNNTHCHQCTVCGLWIHKSCSGITDEFFKHLEEQVKNTGMAYWACRPCTAYSQGITKKMRQVEAKVDSLVNNVNGIKDDLEEVKDEAKKVSDKVDNLEVKLAGAAEKNNDTIFEELRERESRRLNLVLHGIQECDTAGATGRERQDWDKEQCLVLFQVMGLDYDSETIKFCRRVGPVTEMRPLIVGFYTDTERSMVLRRAARLAGTDHSDVTIAPDLTKRQRKEEKDIWAEKETRNKNRTEEQLQKNLVWAVVGGRGEKRLLLQPAREGGQDSQRGRQRGRGRGRPPIGPGRMPLLRQAATGEQLGRGRGKTLQPGGRGRRAAPGAAQELLELPEEEMETEIPGTQGSQKRKAATSLDGQPPDKEMR